LRRGQALARSGAVRSLHASLALAVAPNKLYADDGQSDRLKSTGASARPSRRRALMSADTASADSKRPRPASRADHRFFAVWAILLGSLIVAAVTSRSLSPVAWFAVVMLLYFGAFKIAALIALAPAERRQFTAGRLVAYFLWIGVQPRPFLRGYVPPPSAPRPTWRGFALNVATGAVVLWGVPHLLPEEAPRLLRAWMGLIGWAFLRLFAGFDLLALLFRRFGFPVEKPWFNPAVATSLRDFWGRRWNRIMSGLLRDLLFLPLARRIGAVAAALAVFLYSGVLHEFVSVLAGSGYGGPTLYFLLQGMAFLCEGSHVGRRVLSGSPLIGRCWTALVVIAPLVLVAPPSFMYGVIVPALREMGVPGLVD
jgi:alginate O-acetyltransferase complex protein AlgI